LSVIGIVFTPKKFVATNCAKMAWLVSISSRVGMADNAAV
jgi:hypothetical protein